MIHSELEKICKNSEKERRTLEPFLESMLFPLKRFPNEALKANQIKSYCSVVTHAPVLRHFFEDSEKISLRSVDIYTALHAIQFTKQSTEQYYLSTLELLSLLMFSRNEEKGPIRKELNVIRRALGAEK